MARMIDMTGKTFGKWLVIQRASRPRGYRWAGAFWLCACDCGNYAIKHGAALRRGLGQSCSECFKARAHIRRGSPTEASWRGMWERCTNPNHAHYARYGGRGIKVCEVWGDIDAFVADMGIRPAGMSIDRIDNDGGYDPSNCRWADATTQARNRSNFKLSDDDVACIRLRLNSGEFQRVVAESFGVSRSHVCNIGLGNCRVLGA